MLHPLDLVIAALAGVVIACLAGYVGWVLSW